MEKETLCEADLISQDELCELLNVSRFAIYRAIKKGAITPVMIKGKGHKNFFHKEEIQKWFEGK